LFHCNAGKGRTGTAICATILYAGLINDVKDVLNYYAYQRFGGSPGGVTQPCQIRYLGYFYNLIKKQVKSAPPKMFRQMIINSFPGSSSDTTDSKATVEFYQYHFQSLVRVNKSLDLYE